MLCAIWGSRLEFLCAIISSHMSNGVCHSLHKEASFHANKTLGGQHGLSLMLCLGMKRKAAAVVRHSRIPMRTKSRSVNMYEIRGK